MTKRQKQYKENKAAKVGTVIKCTVCGEEFTKKQYSQAFCCGQCKDAYWNAKGDRHADRNSTTLKRRNRNNPTPRQQGDWFSRLLLRKIEMEIYDDLE